jgi:predicted deacylase
VITGGIHGDEYEGPAALYRLADMLDPAGLAGRVLIVPLANLAAFSAGTRTSPVDLQNLARIFPGDPHGTLSFRLADHLFRHVVTKGDFLIDCHSGGIRFAFLDVAGFYAPQADISTALSAASRDLAADLDLSHLWRLPPRSGVLSYEAMKVGIPVAGVEIGGRGGLLDSERDSYLNGFLRVLGKRGMIVPPALPSARRYATFLDGDWSLAPVGGFIETHVSIGETVDAGQLLATIREPLGGVIAEMRATAGGITMGTRHLCSIQPGEWATCAVREVAA